MNVDIEYALLQSKYREMNSGKSNIFPNEWYNIKAYDLKKKILKECLMNYILITDSSYYYEFRVLALN